MRYSFIVVLCAALVSGVVLAQTQEANDSTSPFDSNHEVTRTPGVISVADFAGDDVIGFLGHPLGTVVRISGNVVDGNSTRSKRDSGRTLLEIHTVNGKELANKIQFGFPGSTIDIPKPMAGEAFDYYAHEHGSFAGVVTPPEEFEIESSLIANDGFWFQPGITIHKSLK